MEPIEAENVVRRHAFMVATIGWQAAGCSPVCFHWCLYHLRGPGPSDPGHRRRQSPAHRRATDQAHRRAPFASAAPGSPGHQGPQPAQPPLRPAPRRTRGIHGAGHIGRPRTDRARRPSGSFDDQVKQPVQPPERTRLHQLGLFHELRTQPVRNPPRTSRRGQARTQTCSYVSSISQTSSRLVLQRHIHPRPAVMAPPELTAHRHDLALPPWPCPTGPVVLSSLTTCDLVSQQQAPAARIPGPATAAATDTGDVAAHRFDDPVQARPGRPDHRVRARRVTQRKPSSGHESRF